MADTIDIANKAQDIILEALIKEQGIKKVKPFFNYEQKCLNCGEPVPTTAHKFCCVECEADFRERQEAERRNFGNG